MRPSDLAVAMGLGRFALARHGSRLAVRILDLTAEETVSEAARKERATRLTVHARYEPAHFGAEALVDAYARLAPIVRRTLRKARLEQDDDKRLIDGHEEVVA